MTRADHWRKIASLLGHAEGRAFDNITPPEATADLVKVEQLLVEALQHVRILKGGGGAPATVDHVALHGEDVVTPMAGSAS